MKKNHISLQRKTNRKSKCIYQRLHKISNYHTFVIYKAANPEFDYPVWENKKLVIEEFGEEESSEEDSSSFEDTSEES